MADSGDTAAKQLRKITECPICLSAFTDPRMLPCIHTFCFQCLKSIAEGAQMKPGDKMPCPLCRKEFPIPDDGVNGVQKNFFMENLLECQATMQMGNVAITCDICSAGDDGKTGEIATATMRCLECQDNYCESCLKVHKFQRLSRNHNLVGIGSDFKSEIRQQFAIKYCTKHTQKPLDYYCAECRKIVCVSCFVESHKSHDCKDVTTVNDEFCQAIEKKALCMSNYADEVMSMRKTFDKRRVDYLRELGEKESLVYKRSHELKKMIDENTKSLLEELSVIKSKHLKEIENELEEIDRCYTILNSLAAYCTELRLKGSASEICSSVDQLIERADELEKNHKAFIGRPHQSIEITFRATDLSEVLQKFNNNIVGNIKDSHSVLCCSISNMADYSVRRGSRNCRKLHKDDDFMYDFTAKRSRHSDHDTNNMPKVKELSATVEVPALLENDVMPMVAEVSVKELSASVEVPALLENDVMPMVAEVSVKELSASVEVPALLENDIMPMVAEASATAADLYDFVLAAEDSALLEMDNTPAAVEVSEMAEEYVSASEVSKLLEMDSISASTEDLVSLATMDVFALPHTDSISVMAEEAVSCDLLLIDISELFGQDVAEVHRSSNSSQPVESLFYSTLPEQSVCSDQTENVAGEVKVLTRKRKRQKEKWKCTVRKRSRQAGLEYISSTGVTVEPRCHASKPFKDCVSKCKFKCTTQIGLKTRQQIHVDFWKQTDDGKANFYVQTVQRMEKARCRKEGEGPSRRKFSYKYYLTCNEKPTRVCKPFYLSTLNVSQRRIEYAHSVKKDPATGIVREDKRGKYKKRDLALENRKDVVRRHISSFPTVESHYRRSSSKKEYLEAGLNIARMYQMYVEQCNEKCEMSESDLEKVSYTQVKESMYRDIFNHEFNLEFHKPKQDRCDMCEEFKNNKENIRFQQHIAGKIATKAERDRDRKGIGADAEAIVCFDLENVLSCPRANISNFFYKRKLSVYHLTAHCSKDKRGYGAVWCETTAGRSANDLASALVTILDMIVKEHPELSKFVLWSDSCISQNRNSVMSFALQTFMHSHPNVQIIEQKFCEPGHSSIQEVDNIHSHIEKVLQYAEVYSPLSLLRMLLKVTPKRPLKLRQMKSGDFRNYQAAAKKLKYVMVPYSKLKHVVYSNASDYSVQYRTSFDDELTTVSIQTQIQRKRATASTATTRSTKKSNVMNDPHAAAIAWPSVARIYYEPKVSEEKKADLLSMIKYMPAVDAEYMESLLATATSAIVPDPGCAQVPPPRNKRAK